MHQGPYTKLLSLDVFEGSNVHTPVYFYIEKKLKMSTFLVYLYKKKTLKSSQTSQHIHTSVHKFCAQLCAQILCYPSHHPALLTTIFSPFFTWPILSLVHSALPDIIPCAQRTALYYPLCTAHCPILSLCTAHCPILSLVHSALPYIIPRCFPYGVILST